MGMCPGGTDTPPAQSTAPLTAESQPGQNSTETALGTGHLGTRVLHSLLAHVPQQVLWEAVLLL